MMDLDLCIIAFKVEEEEQLEISRQRNKDVVARCLFSLVATINARLAPATHYIASNEPFFSR